MKAVKIYILIIMFLIPMQIEAKMWGTMNITGFAINSSLSNKPGTTNILIHKIQVQNTGDFTNDYNYPNNTAYPHLYEMDFDNVGTLASSNITALHLYYDLDGIWGNGDEVECRTGNECQSNVNFDQDYSPSSFGSVNDRVYFGPNLNMHFPTGKTVYMYLTADLSTNILDNATLDVESVTYGIAVHRGDDWTVWGRITNQISAPNLISTSVEATNLWIQNDPSLVNINQGFSMSVSARDKYGNVDEDYTGSITFFPTNVPPTPYSLPFAIISNTNSNPYTFTGADNGYHTFTTNAFKLTKTGVYKILVSDGTLNSDWSRDISVSPAVHHFNITDQNDNNLSSIFITAGKTLLENGITNLKVSARNYVDAIVANYTGNLYFNLEEMSELYSNKIPFDNNPLTPPTTSSTDKFQIKNNGYTNISASTFIIYNAGQNRLLVIDEYGYKGEVNISVVADVPDRFKIDAQTHILAGEPFQYYISIIDKWQNTVELLDTIEIKLYKNEVLFTNHTFPPETALVSGKKNFEKIDNIIINEPGLFTIKIKDKNRPDIIYEGTITVEIGARNYLNIVNNYIEPGEAKEVPIYYNNPYKEEININIKVFDIRGRLIKKYAEMSVISGPSKVAVWDLKNDTNDEVAPGIYIILVEDSKGNKSSDKVVFVK
ncbi:MAG: hypothetical protein KKH98_08140 [Spirochaetes bacterium]|nr:hypothetical protein [Spirochaetota bacterium]